MAADHGGLGDALVAMIGKLAPGIAGSLIALRGLPADAPWSARLTAFAGGAASAYYVAPALYEWVGIASPRIESVMAFVVGAFSMVVVGEITTTIREIQLAGIARDTLRRLLRLDRG